MTGKRQDSGTTQEAPNGRQNIDSHVSLWSTHVIELEDGRMIEGHDYTLYSNGPSGRSRMYAFLALITASLTPVAQHWAIVVERRYWGEDLDIAKAALFFGGFTAMVLYGVLLGLFNGYLWR